MTTVIFVMRFDVAQIVTLIFELPLDREIGAVRVIRILLGLEHGLVVVAVAEDGSGDVVGIEVHDFHQLHIRFKKAYRVSSRFQSALPRCRHGTHMRRARGFFGVDRKRRWSLRSSDRTCPSKLRRTARSGNIHPLPVRPRIVM